MGHQAGESRVYAGIHYPFDVDDGLALARKVAAKASPTSEPGVAERPRFC
jgi:hypothetical protein